MFCLLDFTDSRILGGFVPGWNGGWKFGFWVEAELLELWVTAEFPHSL